MTAVTVPRAVTLPALYFRGMHIPRMTPRKKCLSRGHRKHSTRSEEVAWHLLRDRRLFGLKFRRQHSIRGYILDFYCHELKLAIEVDGESHWGREEYDAMRQKRLEEKGIMFVRIGADELVASAERLVERIRVAKILRGGVIQKDSGQRPSPPTPLPKGEGRT